MTNPTDPPMDPRFFEKNFGMPMDTGGTSGLEFAEVRRKDDGTVEPVVYQPEFGAEFSPGVIPTEIRRRIVNDLPALHVRLVRKENGTRYVTVTEGAVTENVPLGGSVDGVIDHPLSNIWDSTYPNLLREHGPIVAGRAVGVHYAVDKYGFVKSSPTPQIKVAANPAEEVTTHYIPPVGDDLTGAVGSVFVALARLYGSGDGERLEVIHEGNVTHTHDLLSIVKAGGTHDIFKRFNPDTGVFETFGISAGDGITLSKVGGSITINAIPPVGVNMNWEVFQTTFSHDVDGHLVASRATSPEYIVYFRNGLNLGLVDPDDEPVGLVVVSSDRNSV